MTADYSKELETLTPHDSAVEQWLRSGVAAAVDALKADQSRAVTPDQVRQRLANEYLKTR